MPPSEIGSKYLIELISSKCNVCGIGQCVGFPIVNPHCSMSVRRDFVNPVWSITRDIQVIVNVECYSIRYSFRKCAEHFTLAGSTVGHDTDAFNTRHKRCDDIEPVAVNGNTIGKIERSFMPDVAFTIRTVVRYKAIYFTKGTAFTEVKSALTIKCDIIGNIKIVLSLSLSLSNLMSV